MISFTPEIKSEALKIISQYDHGELYTPASVRGTLRLPGWEGGATWQGAGVDPETNTLYVPSARYPILAKLTTPDPETSNVRYVRTGSTSVPGPKGLPLTIPPYGSITAIDLNTGDHKWQIPHGQGPRQKVIDLGIPDPGPLGSASRTGPLVTKTLLFVGQRDAGRTLLRAYDKNTGQVIHELELPSLIASGTPITYSVDGRQYISIAIGGADQAKLVTYALPHKDRMQVQPANAKIAVEAASRFDAATAYQRNCFSCHGTGAGGAPTLDDRAGWDARTKQGIDVLSTNVVEGLNGTMPPRGMCFSCSDDELKAIVRYMLDSVSSSYPIANGH